MRCFTLDTTVLVDALDYQSPSRQALAETLVRGASTVDCMLTQQSIGEFYFVVTRKGLLPPAAAAAQARNLAATFPLVAPTAATLPAALDAAEKGRFAFWDAYLLSAAEQAGCLTCLSTDMHDGAKLGRLVVHRPYSGKTLSHVAKSLLSQP